jgi:hypothetical protein
LIKLFVVQYLKEDYAEAALRITKEKSFESLSAKILQKETPPLKPIFRIISELFRIHYGILKITKKESIVNTFTN